MTQQKSTLAWLGGKSRLADQIIERMPAHQSYCEVFAGAAWVLFKKPPSKVETINDCFTNTNRRGSVERCRLTCDSLSS